MKTIKLNNAAQLADYERAIFKIYRDAELAARGKPQLDIVQATGLPASPQITTHYVKGDPATLEIDVDERVEAMHDREVDVPVGRRIRLSFTGAVNKPPKPDPIP